MGLEERKSMCSKVWDTADTDYQEHAQSVENGVAKITQACVSHIH